MEICISKTNAGDVDETERQKIQASDDLLPSGHSMTEHSDKIVKKIPFISLEFQHSCWNPKTYCA